MQPYDWCHPNCPNPCSCQETIERNYYAARNEQQNPETGEWEPAEPLPLPRLWKVWPLARECGILFLIIWGTFWLIYAIAEWGSPF